MTTVAAETREPRGQFRIETAAKRVRAYLGGEVVADTVRPVLVWEVPYYPAYYSPLAGVLGEVIEADGRVAHYPSRGNGWTVTVRPGNNEAPGAALRYVRLGLLTATDSVSHCPYKGQTEWRSVRARDTVHEDLAWSYRTPLPESQKIARLIAFYTEKVDVHLDGGRQGRPSSKFS